MVTPLGPALEAPSKLKFRIITVALFILLAYHVARLLLGQFAVVPPLFAHAPALVVFLVYIRRLLTAGSIPRLDLWVLFALLPLGVSLLLTGHSLYSSIFFLYVLVVAIAVKTVFGDCLIDPRIVIWLFLVAYVASIILYFAGFQPVKGAPVPLPENAFLLNFSPPGSTVHFSAALSAISFIVSVYCWLLARQSRYLCIAILTASFLVLSYSRTLTLSAFTACAIMIFVWTHQSRRPSYKQLFLVVMSAMAFSSVIFLGDSIGQVLFETFSGTMIGDVLRVSQVETRYGLASSRDMLWQYHFFLFEEHPWGAGLEAVRNLEDGEETEVGRVFAKTESFLTSLLAAYGRFSFVFFGFLVAIFFVGFRNRSVLQLAIVGLFFMVTIGSAILTPPLNTAFFLSAALIFCRERKVY